MFQSFHICEPEKLLSEPFPENMIVVDGCQWQRYASDWPFIIFSMAYKKFTNQNISSENEQDHSNNITFTDQKYKRN